MRGLLNNIDMFSYLFFFMYQKTRSATRQVGIEKLNLKECQDKPTISPAKCYGGEQ